MRGPGRLGGRRAGTRTPTTMGPQGVPSPTQHIPSDTDAASVFLRLVSSRYEESSFIVSSNKSSSAWPESFGDAVAVEAMVDRHIHIITLKRDRYRLEASTTNWPPPMQRREPRRIQPSLAISRLAFRDDDRGPRGVRVAVVGRTERPFGCCLVALSVRVSAGC